MPRERPSKLTPSVNTSVRVPRDLHELLVAKAERLDRTVGWVIVNALRADVQDGTTPGATRAPVTNFDRLQGVEPATAPQAHGPGPKISFTPRPKGGKR